MSLEEAAAAASNAAGRISSQDEGDPSSANLFIRHVAPTVTEERLQALFEEFGEIYSIKIMWPRTGEERARQRNIGFVSFWRRSDAEAAK
jgi:U2-associated protein SR140